MSTLLVVDGDNLAHRLVHAVVGKPVPEVFGSCLGRYRRTHEPTHAVVVFDPEPGAPSWRRELYPPYKAKRGDRLDISGILADCRAQCGFWRIASACADGAEADDLIAAYVETAVREGMDVTIVSGDKDLVQLVRDEPVEVFQIDEARKGRVWIPETCEQHFGVSPRLIPDLLALTGDSSDGYPGVPGIGPKTAVQLLREYESLEGVLANKALVRKTSTMRNLIEHEALARTCYTLAKLRADVLLPVPLDACRWSR